MKSVSELSNAGGDLYLFELARNTTAANIAAYARYWRERSIQRQLISVAADITETAFSTSGRSTAELLDEAEQKVFQIAEHTARGSGPMPIGYLLAKAVDRIDTLFHSDQAITGLSSGYKDLDELTSGLQPADLVIVAGRPSMGKTTFAMNIAEHAAIKNKKPVLVFSMEMPADVIGNAYDVFLR